MKKLLITFVTLGTILAHADIPREIHRPSGGGGGAQNLYMVDAQTGQPRAINPLCIQQNQRKINIDIGCLNGQIAAENEGVLPYQEATLPRGRIFGDAPGEVEIKN
jgi:hypothetical protein